MILHEVAATYFSIPQISAQREFCFRQRHPPNYKQLYNRSVLLSSFSSSNCWILSSKQYVTLGKIFITTIIKVKVVTTLSKTPLLNLNVLKCIIGSTGPWYAFGASMESSGSTAKKVSLTLSFLKPSFILAIISNGWKWVLWMRLHMHLRGFHGTFRFQ